MDFPAASSVVSGAAVTSYCKNRLIIEGSAQNVEVFARRCLSLRNGVYELDFDKILPMPPILKGLREDTPGSLKLTRKHVATLEAADHRSKEAWLLHNWGFTPDRVEYQASHLSETGYRAAFTSPWGAPEGVFRALARRHPELTMRCAALEEASDYSFLLTVQNGVIREERPRITDAFVEEIEGPGEIENRLEFERPHYGESATLRNQPIRHFRHWRNEARLKRALTGYPPYNPPHRGVANMLRKKEARENHEFFLAEKAARIAALRCFLQPFGVALEFAKQTKDALDDWLATYAAFLYVSEVGSSFLTHSPEWTGVRLGLNVILDLGIFLGEFAIKENPAFAMGYGSANGAGPHAHRRSISAYRYRYHKTAVPVPMGCGSRYLRFLPRAMRGVLHVETVFLLVWLASTAPPVRDQDLATHTSLRARRS